MEPLRNVTEALQLRNVVERYGRYGAVKERCGARYRTVTNVTEALQGATERYATLRSVAGRYRSVTGCYRRLRKRYGKYRFAHP